MYLVMGVGRRNILDHLCAINALGPRFVLNMYYCQRVGLFPACVDLPLILDKFVEVMDPLPSQSRTLSIVHRIIEGFYHDEVRKDVHSFVLAPGAFYRVAPFSAFVSGPHAFLSSKAVHNYGIMLSDTFDDNAMRGFSAIATDGSNIAAGTEVRGRHKFAWTAKSDQIFGDLIVSLPGSEEVAARLLCRKLAIEGYGEHEPLFLMRYPYESRISLPVRRPTAFDGFGCMYFKARTNKDSHLGGLEHGFTLDLDLLEPLNGPPDSPPDSCDGMPEYAAQPIEFSSMFHLYWIGRYRESHTSCDESKVDSVIAGSFSIDDALASAKDYLVAL